MAGDSIASTKSALHEIMKELTEQDWVSYSRFGANVVHNTQGLKPCTASTIKRLARMVEYTEADLGGTEMNAGGVGKRLVDLSYGKRGYMEGRPSVSKGSSNRYLDRSQT